MAQRNALGNVYAIAWRHKSPRVRRVALFLLVKGRAMCDRERDQDALDALVDAGCTATYEFVQGHGWMDVLTCDGAKECYENGAFFE